jgi:hypothetical protein
MRGIELLSFVKNEKRDAVFGHNARDFEGDLALKEAARRFVTKDRFNDLVDLRKVVLTVSLETVYAF